MRLVQSIPRLIELDATERSAITARQWNQLLVHSALHGLEALRVGRPGGPRQLDPASVERVAALPRLHTLALHKPVTERVSGWLAALPGATALTALQVTDSFPVSEDSQLGHVAQCTKSRLRRSWLHAPALLGGRFESFFSAPALSRLEHLTISHFSCLPMSARGEADQSAETIESVHFCLRLQLSSSDRARLCTILVAHPLVVCLPCASAAPLLRSDPMFFAG